MRASGDYSKIRSKSMLSLISNDIHWQIRNPIGAAVKLADGVRQRLVRHRPGYAG
jgi:hypothetical protein